MSYGHLSPIEAPKQIPDHEALPEEIKFLLNSLPFVLDSWRSVPAELLNPMTSEEDFEYVSRLPVDEQIMRARRLVNLELRAVIHGHCLRAHQLSSATVKNLESDWILAAVQTARGALESGATAKWLAIRWLALHERKDLEAYEQFVRSLEEQTYGGRLLAQEGMGGTNIMTAFRRLQKDSDFNSLAMIFYDVLSEYAHPNAASLHLFWHMTDEKQVRSIRSSNAGAIGEKVSATALAAIAWTGMAALGARDDVWNVA